MAAGGDAFNSPFGTFGRCLAVCIGLALRSMPQARAPDRTRAHHATPLIGMTMAEELR